MSVKQVVIIVDDFTQSSIANYSNVSLYDYGYFSKIRQWDYYLNSNYTIDGYGDVDYTEQISTTSNGFYFVKNDKTTGLYVTADGSGTAAGLGNYTAYYKDYILFNPLAPIGYVNENLKHGDWVLYSFEKQLDDISSVEIICFDNDFLKDNAFQYVSLFNSLQTIVEGWLNNRLNDGNFYIPTTFSISIAGAPISSELSALAWMVAKNIIVVQSAPNVDNGLVAWGDYYPDVVNVGAWNVDSTGHFLGASSTTLGSVDVYANGYVANSNWSPNNTFGTSFATPRVAAEIVNTFKIAFDAALQMYASGQLTSEQLKTNIGYSGIVDSIISKISKNIYVQDNGIWLSNPLKVMVDDVTTNSGPYVISGGVGLQTDVITATSFLSPFDNIAPTLLTFNPADEATAVTIDSNIVVTLNETIQRGSGDIVLKTDSGTTVATYAQSSSNVTISGSTLTINPTADLNYSTGYKVEFAAGSVKDTAGNNFTGATTYNFTTGAAANTPPAATAVSISTNEDTLKTGTLTATDIDSTSLTYSKVSGPSNGTVTVNSSGTYTYTPIANFNGTDSFTFKANDGTSDSAAATVSITVVAVNDAPIATAASMTTNEDSAKTGTLAAIDIDSTSLTFVKVGSLNNGTVVVNTNGTYTYTPIANFNGTDSFTFKSNDGAADSAAATVSITVSAVNDLPVGTIDITGTAKQGETLTATKNFTDVDGIPVIGTVFTTSWLADGTPITGTSFGVSQPGGFISYSPVLTPELVGKKISFSTTYTDNGGTQETVTSVQTSAVASIGTSGTGTSDSAKFWKDNTKTPADTKKADAVNLTDAIAILKMIVGLNVNSNNTALSPYQAIAADFDQSGDVGLTDAIGVLKMVVGLSAPTPTWKYYDDTKLASTYTSTQSLNPKGWTSTALLTDIGTADSSVKLVGVLTGDVDGSWVGV
jgi:VCBS repeat-containing protein